MQRTPDPDMARDRALQAVTGETGCAALVVVLLATGGGLLLDFQVLKLHPIFTVGLLVASIPASLFWFIRRTLSMSQKPNPNHDYIRNMALATVAGQAGCTTVVLVFAALFGGLFLDSRLNTHPVFTIGLVLVSVPISLYAMTRLMLSSVAAIKPSPPAGAAHRLSQETTTPAEEYHTKEKRS